jgi:hypothetical protein
MSIKQRASNVFVASVVLTDCYRPYWKQSMLVLGCAIPTSKHNKHTHTHTTRYSGSSLLYEVLMLLCRAPGLSVDK